MIFGIDLALAKAGAVGAVAGAAITAIVIFVVHRRRIQRRDAHLYEIPPFLRGTADPADAADSRFKRNWTEIHPLPKHIARGQ